MRVLMQVSIPTEAGNAGIKDGTLGKTLQTILEEIKPEAAYFFENNGFRTGIIVTDLQDPSGIPALAEPFFLSFNARVQIHPAMTPEDLARAGQSLEAAAKKYG
jgi:hypothetical protein